MVLLIGFASTTAAQTLSTDPRLPDQVEPSDTRPGALGNPRGAQSRQLQIQELKNEVEQLIASRASDMRILDACDRLLQRDVSEAMSIPACYVALGQR